MRSLYIFVLILFCTSIHAEPVPLRVAVLVDAPPLSYRDAAGNLTGFSYTIVRAICVEMKLVCDFQVTKLDYLVDDLAQGNYDFAAVGLLNTPDRRQKILFGKPFYRSFSLWYARSGIEPGHPDLRVSVFKGSVQESYAKAQRWNIISAQTAEQMIEQLAAGISQAMIAPLMTSFNLQKNARFMQLGLVPTVLRPPELAGYASFGISPKRGDLKEVLDHGLDRIIRNGTYDRINAEFLPFSVY